MSRDIKSAVETFSSCPPRNVVMSCQQVADSTPATLLELPKKPEIPEMTDPYGAYNAQMQAKADASAKFSSGAQSQKDTCALMSANSVLYEKTGSKDVPGVKLGILDDLTDLVLFTPSNEKQMMKVAEGHGYTQCNGTWNEAAVMTAAGIPAHLVQRGGTSTDRFMEKIAGEVEAGKGVTVAYDTRPVWGGRWLKDPEVDGHTVRVTGVERDSDGKITAMYVNDSGNGVAPERVPADTFAKALNWFGGGRIAVSDDPLFAPIQSPRTERS